MRARRARGGGCRNGKKGSAHRDRIAERAGEFISRPASNPAVIPGPFAIFANGTRNPVFRPVQQELDSGSPLRGVRNDELLMTL